MMGTSFRKRLPLGAAITLLALAPLAPLGLAVSDDARTGGTPAADAPDTAALVARGRYLVEAVGCHDCHTPMAMGPAGPEHDMARALSGHPEALVLPPSPVLADGPWLAVVSASMTAWSGPWGVSYTANLTPDEDTGLGLWTFENFRDTIRTGRHLGRGREILPPMPIAAFRNFSDQDLEAIYRYLRTIPPVRNRVPEPLPPPGVPPAAAPADPG